MGYCPRCGENSPYSESSAGSSHDPIGSLRIPAGSRIVDLGDPGDGTFVTYGGSRFRIHRHNGSLLLELAD